MSHPQYGRIVEGAADDLHRQWHPAGAEPDALRQRRAARDVERRRQGRTLPEFDRAPSAEARRRRAGRRGDQHIEIGVDRFHFSQHAPPLALGLDIIAAADQHGGQYPAEEILAEITRPGAQGLFVPASNSLSAIVTLTS